MRVSCARRQNAGLLVTLTAAASAGEERSRHILQGGEGRRGPTSNQATPVAGGSG